MAQQRMLQMRMANPNQQQPTNVGGQQMGQARMILQQLQGARILVGGQPNPQAMQMQQQQLQQQPQQQAQLQQGVPVQQAAPPPPPYPGPPPPYPGSNQSGGQQVRFQVYIRTRWSTQWQSVCFKIPVSCLFFTC